MKSWRAACGWGRRGAGQVVMGTRLKVRAHVFTSVTVLIPAPATVIDS